MVLSLTHVGCRPSLRCHSRLSEGVLALGGSIVTVALSRCLRTITLASMSYRAILLELDDARECYVTTQSVLFKCRTPRIIRPPFPWLHAQSYTHIKTKLS